MSTIDCDPTGAVSKTLHFDALVKLKARLHDLCIVDYDPLSYAQEESFRKEFELREI